MNDIFNAKYLAIKGKLIRLEQCISLSKSEIKLLLLTSDRGNSIPDKYFLLLLNCSLGNVEIIMYN